MEQKELDLGFIIRSISKNEALKDRQEEINRIASDFQLAQETPTHILVCGEFKRGKSTFVNALLGRNLCATDTDICTSVVSQIRYGEKEKVTRYYGDFSNIKSEVIDLNQLEQFTVGSAGNIDNTLYVEIELPNPVLKEGWVIIDTPGVGGLDPRHAILTNYFLPRADVTLFMTDVNEPLTETEIEYFKNKVKPYCKQFAVVVNKADLKDAATVEDFRQDTINKIATETQLAHDQVLAVAVSSAAEAYPESGLGESNFGELRELINTLVSQYRGSVKNSIRYRFVELLNLAIAPIQAQINQIEKPDVDQISDLTKQKSLIEKKIADLTNPTSGFRVSINRLITEKREEIQNDLDDASLALTEILRKLLENPNSKTVKGGEWLGSKLNDSFVEMSSNLTLELNEVFEEISNLPEFEGMLQYEMKDFNGKIAIRDVDTSVPLHKHVTPLSSGAFPAMAAGTIASFLLGPLGTALVALGTGTLIAWRTHRDATNAYVEANLQKVYQPVLSGAIKSLNTYIQARFQEFQTEWLDTVTKRAMAYKESLQESIESIQKIKQEINQAVTLKMQLQNKLTPLIKARDSANKITF